MNLNFLIEKQKKFFIEITVGELLKLYKKRHDKILFFDWRTKKQIHPKIDVSSLRVYGFKISSVRSNGSEELMIVLDKTQLDQLKKAKPK